MPSRSTVTRYDTPVQGNDAWVEIEAITYGELKAITKQAKEIAKTDDAADANMRLTEQLIVSKVKAWNWVDDEGKPLPSPHLDPDVVNTLTTHELTALSLLVMNTDEAKKKPTT